jgi:hypothetical protein
MPKNAARNPKFNFNDVDCIGGFYIAQGILPYGNHVIPKFNIFNISKRYYTMLPSLLADLQFSNQSFITLHWRRGDQLTTRCSAKSKEFITQKDTSVNCHSVKEFIDVTKSLFEREKISNAAVFVATNENSTEVFQLNLIKQSNNIY